MSAAEPTRFTAILPPISREAHDRLVAEAVAAERERIAKWLIGRRWSDDSMTDLAEAIRAGDDRRG